MSDSQQILLRVQVVAGAMLVAVLGFMVVVWVLTSGAVAEPQPLVPLPAPVPGVLVLVGALLLVAAPLVERRLATPPAAPTASVDPESGTLDPSHAAGAAGPGPGQRYQTAKVVSFALRESAALLGLLTALATGEGAWGYALGAAALVTMVIAWPRASDLASRPADLDAPPESPVEPR